MSIRDRFRRISVCAVIALGFASFSRAAVKSPQGIVAVPTITTVVSSKNPSTFGEPVTFTATVVTNPGTGTTNAPSAAPVGGSVTFKDGATPLGTVPINAGGVAAVTTSSLATGPHNITAQYGGAPGFVASTSTVLVQTVNAPAATVEVPTLGGVGLLLLGVLLGVGGLWLARRSLRETSRV